MNIPTLETDDLILRAFRDTDLDDYAAMLADPKIVRHIRDGEPYTREESWRSMAFFHGHWSLRGYGMWAVEHKETHRCIGRVGLHNPEGWPGLEVGWLIDSEYWGQGYATQGARASLDYAFSILNAEQVLSLIKDDNLASIRVAEKIGETFIREDTLLGFDHHVYGIKANEYNR